MQQLIYITQKLTDFWRIIKAFKRLAASAPQLLLTSRSVSQAVSLLHLSAYTNATYTGWISVYVEKIDLAKGPTAKAAPALR